MGDSLGTEFPKEQERVRGVLKLYEDLGPAGMFGAVAIKDTLRRAEIAIASGDVVEILKLYEELKTIED